MQKLFVVLMARNEIPRASRRIHLKWKWVKSWQLQENIERIQEWKVIWMTMPRLWKKPKAVDQLKSIQESISNCALCSSQAYFDDLDLSNQADYPAQITTGVLRMLALWFVRRAFSDGSQNSWSRNENDQERWNFNLKAPGNPGFWVK